MKFQKNKDGFWETQYEDCDYILDGREWKPTIKYTKSVWSSHTHPNKKVFIIPISKKSSKEAEADIKKLLNKYSEDIDFKSHNTIQGEINRAFRRVKLDEIKWKSIVQV